ncbi:MAG: type II toxin-antitoxin system VapC family toxin [Mycobacteriales bacterium]
MIIPDVNLLLYAVVSGFPQHRVAHAWWERTVNDTAPIGLTPPAVFGFLRIATSGRSLTSPLAVADAVGYVRDWLAQPAVNFVRPGQRHLEIALDLVQDLGTAGNLTTDIQLAAYAVEADGVVHSNDTDFARFPNLRWVNPLQ